MDNKESKEKPRESISNKVKKIFFGTKKRTILSIAVLVILVGSCLSIPTEKETSTTTTPTTTSPPTTTPEPTTTPPPTTTPAKELKFAEKLKEEIDTTWVDIEEVEYIEVTKQVNVYFVKETAWDTKHLRDSFCYASFDIMETLIKYPDKIDGITLIGKTKLIDSKGNESIDKVFQADITMGNAKEVNWGNLEKLGTLEPLNNNFDDVWWHPAVRP